MNLKKLVTVIVAGFALCLMMNVSCEAAATTKATTKEEYTESELRYMSSIIYCEARGESYAGQKAVGIVVMNRVRSKSFPDSVKEVIYQRGQFSPVRNGSFSRALKLYDKQNRKGKFKQEMKSCRKAAKEVLEGSTTITVRGKKKQMKSYLFFSRYIAKARYQLGSHQFK
ncbi:MAG: cell wall hydrolase [Clostridium sp.]|nr:cell wall hydrolase [Clostridium sp.]